MAILIGLHGQESRVGPLSGLQFTEDDVKSLLECLQLEAYIIGSGRVLIWNDSPMNGNPVNHRATDLLWRSGGQAMICGPALLTERKELSWMP